MVCSVWGLVSMCAEIKLFTCLLMLLKYYATYMYENLKIIIQVTPYNELLGF